jgi:hypothetical protein
MTFDQAQWTVPFDSWRRRLNHLNPVYHGEHGLRTLKELVRSYLTITKDLSLVMTRVKALYRS